MNQWLAAAGQMVRVVLGQPRSSLELTLTALAGALILLFTLKKASAAFGARNTGFFLVLVTATLGVALTLAALTAARLYLPWWQDPSLRVWLLAGAGAAAALIVIAPFICSIHKVGYIGGLFSWLLSAASVAIVIMLIGSVFQMFASGASSVGKGVQHKQQVENALK